jgi:histidine ammonia-lyase
VEDRHFAPDIAMARALVESGAVLAACPTPLPVLR